MMAHNEPAFFEATKNGRKSPGNQSRAFLFERVIFICVRLRASRGANRTLAEQVAHRWFQPAATVRRLLSRPDRTMKKASAKGKQWQRL
jgi:hypothetical protein